jgi:hypothetical protein
MKRPLIVVLAAVVLVAAGAFAWWLVRAVDGVAAGPTSVAAADRMDKKLSQILENGSRPVRTPLVTTLSEEEINSYFEYRMAEKIPKGVSKVRLTLSKDRVSGTATVNFDQVKAAQKKPVNPLLDNLLTGTKPISAAGTFTSQNGTGVFHLEEVSIGSMNVSGFLLDLLIRHFIKPRYPNVAIDSPFPLPEHIDRIVIEQGHVVIYQK